MRTQSWLSWCLNWKKKMKKKKRTFWEDSENLKAEGSLWNVFLTFMSREHRVACHTSLAAPFFFWGVQCHFFISFKKDLLPFSWSLAFQPQFYFFPLLILLFRFFFQFLNCSLSLFKLLRSFFCFFICLLRILSSIIKKVHFLWELRRKWQIIFGKILIFLRKMIF